MISFDNKKISDVDEREKSKIFKDELLKFNTLHGRENFKVPQIGGKELDLYKLYKEVINRGGSQLVSENKQWKEIVNALELPASCTSASFTLRNHYNRCLQSYEAYFVKNQNNPSAPISQITPMNIANPNPTINNNQTISISNQPAPKKEENFLGKKVVRNDAEYNLIFRYQGKPQLVSRDKTYQKKVRLLNAVPDMRKIVLAFESHVTSEIIWSLNILLLFSSNNSCNLHLEYQPYLIESMTNYLYYCVNNISDLHFLIDIIEGNFSKSKNDNNFNSNTFKDASTRLQNKRAKSFNESTTFHFLDEINNTISLSTISKKNKNLLEVEKKKNENQINLNLEEVSEYELIEHLITIIQIIRNLSFIKANEAPILKCQKFTSMLNLIFIWTNIQDLKINCLDIITNLSKHIVLKEIKYPLELLNTVYEFLKNPNREVSEQALECLRRLTIPSGNDDFFEKMPDEFFDELINLLMSYKLEIREAAIEILYYISDQKLPTKTRLGKQNKCIQRLVAIVCSNSSDSKISKWAVCTLAKLAEVPSILKIINCYEQELFLAACTDESISRIIMGILSN